MTLLFTSLVSFQAYSVLVPFGRGGGAYQTAAKLVALLQAESGQDWVLESGTLPDFDHLLGRLNAEEGRPHFLIHTEDLIGAVVQGRLPADLFERLLLPLAVLEVTHSQLFVRSNDHRLKSWRRFTRYCGRMDCQVTLFGDDGGSENLNLRLLEARIRKQRDPFSLHRQFLNRPTVRYIALAKGEVDVLVEQPADVNLFLEADLFQPIFTFSGSVFADEHTSLLFMPRVRLLFQLRGSDPDQSADLAEHVRDALGHEEFKTFLKHRHGAGREESRWGQAETGRLVRQLVKQYKSYRDLENGL